VLRKKGEVIYSKSIGYVEVDKNLKANNNSKYRIGSISKTFTAVLVMKAVESNLLQLDQNIHKWFPSIKNAKKITIRHLLQHRSGLHNFTDNKDFYSWNTQSKTEAEMVAIIAKGGSDFQPNSKAEYSNSNFVLLTYILEKTYKKTYAQLLQEQIVNPLQLKNTYVFSDINTDANECASYKYQGKWKKESETHYSIPLGAGAITSTPFDLTLFADALLEGKILRPESLEEMKSIKADYGLGLFQVPFYEHIAYGHTGGIDGFTSVLAHFDSDSLSFAITCNGGTYDINNVAIALLSEYFDKPYDIPVFTTYNLKAEELDQYIGTYSSEEINLEINFTKEDLTLFAQGTGQPIVALDPIAKDTFQFEQADAIFEFDLPNATLFLKQNGAVIKFKRIK